MAGATILGWEVAATVVGCIPSFGPTDDSRIERTGAAIRPRGEGDLNRVLEEMVVKSGIEGLNRRNGDSGFWVIFLVFLSRFQLNTNHQRI